MPCRCADGERNSYCATIVRCLRTSRGEPAWSQTSWSASWEEIGKRLVNGLAQWDGPDGQVRGICMFETEYRNTAARNYRYHTDTEFNPDLTNPPKNVTLARLGHQAPRQRARSASGCP